MHPCPSFPPDKGQDWRPPAPARSSKSSRENTPKSGEQTSDTVCLSPASKNCCLHVRCRYAKPFWKYKEENSAFLLCQAQIPGQTPLSVFAETFHSSAHTPACNDPATPQPAHPEYLTHSACVGSPPYHPAKKQRLSERKFSPPVQEAMRNTHRATPSVLSQTLFLSAES